MGFWFTLAHAARALFWLALIAILALQLFGSRDNTQAKRDAMLEQFQTERKSRVIALIHRQESRSILGVDVANHIDIEDSEAVLRAIRLTPMDLYPQSTTQRPSVIYIPMRNDGKGEPAPSPSKRDTMPVK